MQRMMRMANLDDAIEEIKIRVDIADIIGEYVQLKQSGANFKGLCPFHSEKTPSFNVNTSKQIYKCFGCGEGGDVISFIMKVENLDFIDSVKFLADRVGIEIDDTIDDNTRQKMDRAKKFQEMNIEAARFFYVNLKNSEFATSYLKKRGLDEHTIKTFGLGYAPDSWDSLKNYMKSKGYSYEQQYDSGLLSIGRNGKNYYDKFRNRVIFPIFDYRGQVIGFGGRVMDDSLPKYLNSPDTDLFNKRYNLYGLNFSRKFIGADRTLILVEGYMDLISFYQFEIRNVVATLGTALTIEQARLIKRFADNVVLAYDMDSAGVNAKLRAIPILQEVGVNVKVLNIKDAKDPDEFVRSTPKGDVLSAISNSIPAMEYRISILRSNHDMGTPEGRRDFLKEATELIGTIDSSIERDYYIGYLSRMTDTNYEVIASEAKNTTSSVKNKNKKSDKYYYVDAKKLSIDNDENYLEKFIIRLMMDDKDTRDRILFKLDRDGFEDENSKKIYDLFLNNRDMGIINTNGLMGKLELDNSYIDSLSSILVPESFKQQKEVDSYIGHFITSKTEKRLKELLKRQKVLEDRRKTIEENTKEAKEVDLEIMSIALEIISEKKKLKSF